MHRPYTFTANCFRRYVDAVGSSAANCFRRYVDAVGSSAANCYRTIRRSGRDICSGIVGAVHAPPLHVHGELFQTIRRCGRVICSELLQDDTSKRSGHLQRTVTGRYVEAVGSSAANCYRTIRRCGRVICSELLQDDTSKRSGHLQRHCRGGACTAPTRPGSHHFMFFRIPSRKFQYFSTVSMCMRSSGECTISSVGPKLSISMPG